MKSDSRKMVGGKWARPVGLVAVALIVIAWVGAGTWLFNYIIVSKKLSHMELRLDPAVQTSVKALPIYTDWYKAQDFQTLDITASDGVPLKGWLLKATNPSPNLVVLIHGYMVSAPIMAAYAKSYAEQGFSVFLADNRGHGQSGGSYVGFGWQDKDDYMKWLSLVLSRNPEIQNVVIHGISMGGATVASLSGEDLPRQVKALVADCSYTSLQEEVEVQIGKQLGLFTSPIAWIASVETKILAGYSFSEASPLDQVKRNRTPILFIHGANDSFTPPRMSQRLFEVATGPKELWIVPEAEHGKAFDVNPDAYFVHVERFYSQYLGAADQED